MYMHMQEDKNGAGSGRYGFLKLVCYDKVEYVSVFKMRYMAEHHVLCAGNIANKEDAVCRRCRPGKGGYHGLP